MYDEIKSNRPARYILLTLAFVAAAVAAYSLEKVLPPAKYLLTPRTHAQPSVLTAFLPVPYADMAAGALECTMAAAVELFLWLAGGLAAFPLLIPAAAYRGVCFGLALSITAGGTSVLAGGNIASLAGYVLVTILMIRFSGCLPDGSMRRRSGWAGRLMLSFLTIAGAVFWITLLCSRPEIL